MTAMCVDATIPTACTQDCMLFKIVGCQTYCWS